MNGDRFTDWDWQKTEDGYYDISINEYGDIGYVSSFRTSILMTFFCQKRADLSEIALPQYRGGWWGNLYNGYNDFQDGSKNWLLKNARATQDTLNKSVSYNKDAYQWFVNDKWATNLTVTARYLSSKSLSIPITLFEDNNVVATIGVDLWKNTIKIEGDNYA